MKNFILIIIIEVQKHFVFVKFINMINTIGRNLISVFKLF